MLDAEQAREMVRTAIAEAGGTEPWVSPWRLRDLGLIDTARIDLLFAGGQGVRGSLPTVATGVATGEPVSWP